MQEWYTEKMDMGMSEEMIGNVQYAHMSKSCSGYGLVLDYDIVSKPNIHGTIYHYTYNKIQTSMIEVVTELVIYNNTTCHICHQSFSCNM